MVLLELARVAGHAVMIEANHPDVYSTAALTERTSWPMVTLHLLPPLVVFSHAPSGMMQQTSFLAGYWGVATRDQRTVQPCWRRVITLRAG